MSLSTIKYANRLNLIDDNEQIIGGVMIAYEAVNTLYNNFIGTRFIDITFLVTGENVWNTVDLVNFNNGLKLSVSYECYDNGNQRNLRRNYQLKKGNVIVAEYGVYFNGIIFNPQHSYRPFENCKHSICDTVYDTNPAVAGDEASRVCIPGSLYFPQPAIVDPINLEGSISVDDLTHDWVVLGGPNYFSTDQELNAFKQLVITGGDGKDPFTEDEPSPDPDPSGPGGGDRPNPGTDTPIDFPDLPSVNVIQTGLVTMYNPDNTQLRSLAGVLWGNDFEQSIKKILNDPFDGVIGLCMIPFTPTVSGSEHCQIGNFDTEVSMPLVSAQWMTLNAGTVKIDEAWKNALDYSPSTILDIFIPFVGFRELKTEDVMGKTLALKYNVDLFTGSAIAMVKCGDKVLYTYPCKLTYDVPLTGSNKASLYTGMINIAMSAIHGAAVGGAMGAVGGAATSAIQTATSKQSNVDRSGAITSNTGDLGEFTPYVILHRPVQSMPADFKQIKGYQSNITALLSACNGYTEVDFVHLTGISGATDTELQEIESLLKEGVII